MAFQRRFRYQLSKCFSLLFIVVSLCLGWLSIDSVIRLVNFDPPLQSPSNNSTSTSLEFGTILSKARVALDHANLTSRDSSCTFWACFNPYRCNFYGDYRLTVYIYPWRKFCRLDNDGAEIAMTPEPSIEFVELLHAIRHSPYYEPNPERACVFIPAVDTLNEGRLVREDIGAVLASLEWWKNGENHLLFNMLPGTFPEYNSSMNTPTGRAIIAGGGFSMVHSYRRSFDVTIPVYNPHTRDVLAHGSRKRSWLLISTKPFLFDADAHLLRNLQRKYQKDFLIFEACRDDQFNSRNRCMLNTPENNSQFNRIKGPFKYPEVLETAKFCLVLPGNRLGQPELSDAIQFGCVPVVIIDEYVLPYHDVLDWKRAAVMIYRHQLEELVDILKRDIDEKRYAAMRVQGVWFWKAYCGSLANIAMTTLRILQGRVFPHQARSYSEWNDNKKTLIPPSFVSSRIAPNDGFTAVILTYDRIPTLFQQLIQLSRVHSLVKIVVIWNNQRKDPPAAEEWPKLNKPLKVIRTSENRLTNRFVPYNVIETEAVLSLDDDILMLNTDELEFGYQAWREFPSYLVGYPPRVHIFDANKQHWTYESEWTNNVSLILTGAAFYHNYYNLLFTETMPGRVKNWIDSMMNCEDIAMNFMIANLTGQPALKVTPRKKFKPSGTTGHDLSADSTHLKQRSECLNRLSRYFGGMVLKTVEFRLDPLLYKVDVPDDAKAYPDVGQL